MLYGRVQIVVIEYSSSVVRERVKNTSNVDISFDRRLALILREW